MYQALYRKWRPLVFSDVCGQAHITETLRRQVDIGRFTHAYLFTGTRGTGKTTCAKILSRAVNCLRPVCGDPCNECPSCRGILDGSILDVIEIDAASNSGVDNIRALRDEIVYSPVAVKYRVYIIDEVHMLSVGAFNALLKTLEEPPAHVLFILATTETHKVPATIVSRCQRFAFKRIPADIIAARLKAVAQAEKIDVTPQALTLLSGMSDGALRDAVSLLDQCSGAHPGVTLDTVQVYDTLGLADADVMVEWSKDIAERALPGVLRRLDELYQSGRDLSSIFDQLSTLLRDLLMFRLLEEPPVSGHFTVRSLQDLSALFTSNQLIEMIRMLQETQSRFLRGFNKRMEAELCLVKLCGHQPEPGAAPTRRQADSRSPEPQSGPVAAQTVPASDAQTQSGQGKNAPPVPPADKLLQPKSPPGGDFAGQWQKVLKNADAFHKSFLDAVDPIDENGRLILVAPDDFSAEILRQPDFKAYIENYFPGGADVLTHRPKADTKKRLDELIERGGDIIQIN